MKKIIFIILTSLAQLSLGADTISIIDNKPMPPKVVAGSTIRGLQYQIHNNSSSSTYNISFVNLKEDGITYTTSCNTLIPDADCFLYLTFSVPGLPTGVTSSPYVNEFIVKGAPKDYKKILATTIIQGSLDITPSIKIGLDTSGVTTATNSYDVTLTPTTGSAISCNAMTFGTSNFCEAVQQGEYTISVTPSTVTGSDTKTYDKPADFPEHLTKDGQEVLITYVQNKDITTSTVITAPNFTGSDFAIEVKGAGIDVTHDQAVGTNEFGALPAGQYTVSAPTSYVGSDTKTYILKLSNPYTIDAENTDFAITYEEKPADTTHVNTVITASTLAAGKTVTVACNDGGSNTYSHNQPSGTHSYDTMVDASYTCTSSDFSVGQDTYEAEITNPVVIDSEDTSITISYHKKAPVSGDYDWHASHMIAAKEANIFGVVFGGGSTTTVINGSTWPPLNPRLVTKVMEYENGTTITVQATAQVQNMPAYIGMGTITETDASDLATNQLKTLKMDTAFHYVGNGSGDRGCFVDGVGEAGCSETFDATHTYDPLVDKLATQARAVKAVNDHTLVNGVAFYTIDMSDGTDAIKADTETDDNVIKHIYNLIFEAKLMEDEYTQNSTPMIMFLNPDSVFPYQTCSQWYCPVPWKQGLSNDTSSKVISIQNLKADTDAAIDRFATKGHITTEQATTFKNDLNSSGILTPPAPSKRTNPGLPELALVYNWVMKTFSPHVAFGWGMNFYDNANPILNPTGKAQPWQTASAQWIHKINHIGLTSQQVLDGISTDATMLANYAKDMNFYGNLSGNYKPDFIYFDKYERDAIPSFAPIGFAFNGVDWDTYLQYIKDFENDMGHPPIALWQIPGATIQVTGATVTGTLADTGANWLFGSPDLNNNFSNWLAAQKSADNVAWTATMNTSVYFTTNSNVSDLQDYLRLAAGHP